MNAYIVRIVTEEAFQGLTTSYVGPFDSLEDAQQRVTEVLEDSCEGLGVEAYVETLYAP